MAAIAAAMPDGRLRATRAKALLNKVGIIRFHELPDQAPERRCRYSFH